MFTMTEDDEPTWHSTGAFPPEISVTITATQPIVIGRGFLPSQRVTIRLVEADETVNYYLYSADADGALEAALPTTLPHGTLTISATDERSDTIDDPEWSWTDAKTIHW